MLAVLAVSDAVFIVSSGLFTVKQAIEFDLPGYNVVFPYVIYPVAAISMTGQCREISNCRPCVRAGVNYVLLFTCGVCDKVRKFSYAISFFFF